jgi:hypothetical protein
MSTPVTIKIVVTEYHIMKDLVQSNVQQSDVGKMMARKLYATK